MFEKSLNSSIVSHHESKYKMFKLILGQMSPDIEEIKIKYNLGKYVNFDFVLNLFVRSKQKSSA